MSASARFVSVAVTAFGFFVAAFGSASVAEAGTVKLIYEPSFYSDGADGGGEFKVTNLTGYPTAIPALGPGVQVTTGGVTGAFQTFCLEYGEHFKPGYLYDYSVSTAANGGGFGASPGRVGDLTPATAAGDPIDARTAYLYSRFLAGNLSWTAADLVTVKNYNYTLGSLRAASAKELQRAIWYIEGERSLADIGGAASDAYRLFLLADQAVTSGAWTGLGGIQVMNVFTTVAGADGIGGTYRQSQLAPGITPPTFEVVPVPSAAWGGLGLLAGLGAVSAFRRRNRNVLA